MIKVHVSDIRMDEHGRLSKRVLEVTGQDCYTLTEVINALLDEISGLKRRVMRND